MTMRWRLVKFHQHCRHTHASWENRGNVEESSEFLGIPDAQAETNTGNLAPPVRAEHLNFGGVPATYSAPISRSTMVPLLFQGLVQSTNTRMTPTRSEYNSGTSPDKIRNVGAESNNYRSPLHLSSRNTGLDASFVTAVPTSRSLFSESQVPSNDPFTVNHDSFDNSGSRVGIRVSSPHQRTEALSQSRSSPNNNVHSIVTKWNINYSGKRDSSAEEFLMRVEECRRGSCLTDEGLFRALPFLIKPPAQ